MTLDKQAVERVVDALEQTCADLMREGQEPGIGWHSERYARAAIAALVPQEEEVAWAIKHLRDYNDQDLQRIADLLERLVGIQGK